MAASSMCKVGMSLGMQYNWTRCDWRILNKFDGGAAIIYYAEARLSKNTMVVDFIISTYPSIICWSACISSPESVYYESDGNNVFSGIYNLSCITYYYIPFWTVSFTHHL